MNTNFKKIYVSNTGYKWYYDYVINVLIYDKNYFYNIYIEIKNNIFMFLPQCKYKNNKECKL